MTLNLDKNTYDFSGAGDFRLYLLSPVPTTNRYHDVGPVSFNKGKLIPFENENQRILVNMGVNSLPDGIQLEYDITVYSVHVDFNSIDEIYPYDKTTDEYRKNTRDYGSIEINRPKIREMGNFLSKTSKNDLEYARNAFQALQKALKWKTTGKYGNLTDIFSNRGCRVRIKVVPGLESYSGSERNGVRSESWKAFEKSFTVGKDCFRPALIKAYRTFAIALRTHDSIFSMPSMSIVREGRSTTLLFATSPWTARRPSLRASRQNRAALASSLNRSACSRPMPLTETFPREPADTPARAAWSFSPIRTAFSQGLVSSYRSRAFVATRHPMSCPPKVHMCIRGCASKNFLVLVVNMRAVIGNTPPLMASPRIRMSGTIS